VTSVGIPPLAFDTPKVESLSGSKSNGKSVAHATLTIERGDSPGTEFRLVNNDSTIGRWDADNGIFPDVDLDAYDSDAKVSRRHARILRKDGSYFIEDLGSTNGTYVNRGRRLLPGNSQPLNDGDEVIVGKTFLRFQITH
jgi:pSer/pThr/pTyr-binding forkhead associated (FHA) protein